MSSQLSKGPIEGTLRKGTGSGDMLGRDPDTSSDLPLSPLTELGSQNGTSHTKATTPDSASADLTSFEGEGNVEKKGESSRAATEPDHGSKANVDAVPTLEGSLSTRSSPESEALTPLSGSQLKSSPPIGDDENAIVALDETNGNDGNVTPISSSSTRKRKRRSSSSSPGLQERTVSVPPAPSSSTADALAVFGTSLAVYSVTGPPGGALIGYGLPQCDPADDGRVSVCVYVDPGAELIIGGTANAEGESEPPTKKTKGVRRKGGRPSKASNKTKEISKTASRPGARSTKKAKLEEDAEPLSKPQPVPKSKKRKPDLNEHDPTNSSCHICRQRNNVPKMVCNASRKEGVQCVFRYCIKCIKRRFTDVHFDAYDNSFVCPRCLGTCSCAACRKLKQSSEGDHGEVLEGSPRNPSPDAADHAEASALHERPLDPLSTQTVSKSSEDAVPDDKKSSSMQIDPPTRARRRASMKARASLKRVADKAFSEEELDAPKVDVDQDSASGAVVVATKVTLRAGPSNGRVLKKAKVGPRSKEEFFLDRSPASVRKFCHQCRRRDIVYAKMSCNTIKEDKTACQMQYCHRCIVKRYPDIVFSPGGSFQCPRCADTCNCDICTPKRGERYIGAREFQTMLEANGVIKPDTMSSLVPSTRQKKTQQKMKAPCKVELESVNIGEEAEEWIRQRRQELSEESEGRSGRHTRVFVGECPILPFYARFEMGSAETSFGQVADSETIGSPKRRLYVGSATELRRPVVPTDGTHCSDGEDELPDEDDLLGFARDGTVFRSRSGRLIKPSAKRQQHGSDGDFALQTPPKKERRKQRARPARNNSSPLTGVPSTSKTPEALNVVVESATKDAPVITLGSSLTDLDAAGESDANSHNDKIDIDSPEVEAKADEQRDASPSLRATIPKSLDSKDRGSVDVLGAPEQTPSLLKADEGPANTATSTASDGAAQAI